MVTANIPFKNSSRLPTSGEDERDGMVKAIEIDEIGKRLHFRGNSKSTGYIIYTVSLVI